MVNVIAPRTLVAFWSEHPDAEGPLRAWLQHVQRVRYSNFSEVKADFGSADWTRGFIIFNVGGNKYRLICTVNFQYQTFWIKHVLTHFQYDQWKP